jgi:hypothetical protein
MIWWVWRRCSKLDCVVQSSIWGVVLRVPVLTLHLYWSLMHFRTLQDAWRVQEHIRFLVCSALTQRLMATVLNAELMDTSTVLQDLPAKDARLG